jgi:glycerophosphoryl diester phosphodiesterase
LLPGIAVPFVVAHRGGAVEANGDVFAGIDRAAAAGVAMVELDVRRRRDDLVVFHGGPPGRPTPGVSHSDAQHPTLQAVLEHIDGRLAVDLELKEPGYESDVVSLALRYLSPESLVLTSFLDEAVRAAHRSAPEIATGLIVGRDPLKYGLVPAISDVFPFRRLAEVAADFLAPNHLLDLTGMRARAASREIPLLLWTVNDAKKLEEALGDRRLLGVVTDTFTPSR